MASPFQELAERHDLDYAARVAPGSDRRFPLPRGDVSDIAGGLLPGGREGIVARVRKGEPGADSPREFTLVVTRIPESVDFARFITCVEADFRGPIERALGPGGLGWIREFQFESIEFNRRYRIVMFRTGNENRLRQLFAPTFLDWMAHTALEGLYFDLVSGVLTVTLAAEPAQTADDLERACGLATHVAERIRDEALEGVGLGDEPAAGGEAAWAEAEAKFASQLEEAGLEGGASDVATAAERLAPIVGRRGLLGRLFGGRQTTEVKMLALSAVFRSYADRAGLDRLDPRGLHDLLPFLDHFPLAVMRLGACRGRLPGSGSEGELAALLDLAGLGDNEPSCRPAAEVAAAGRAGDFVHVLPRTGGSVPVAIGGFSLALDGESRVTDASRRAREAAAALATSIGGDRSVVSNRGGAPVDAAAQAWLEAEPAGALVLEGGRLTLVGAPRPLVEWSFETLDAFCGSIGPTVAPLAPD